ncbi:unnamed protein product [Amoebophrya sp. A25]|nr:unnamed protein product [Amoebophrya sp. A25]|eukprot:GSA25T00021635001.1
MKFSIYDPKTYDVPRSQQAVAQKLHHCRRVQAEIRLNHSSGYLRSVEKRQNLPAFRLQSLFLEACATFDVVVLCGETGSGKTTQLPQLLI